MKNENLQKASATLHFWPPILRLYLLNPYSDRTTEYHFNRQYDNFGGWKSSFCVKIRLQVAFLFPVARSEVTRITAT